MERVVYISPYSSSCHMILYKYIFYNIIEVHTCLPNLKTSLILLTYNKYIEIISVDLDIHNLSCDYSGLNEKRPP